MGSITSIRYQISDIKNQTYNIRYLVSDINCWISSIIYQVSDIRYQISSTGCIKKNAPPSLLNFSGYMHARRLGHISFERWDP